jgi:hypothetical protein
MGIEQHLVPLSGVGHQPQRPAGAQLHVRYLHLVVDATHHQTFFAPVELERLARLERQRHKGMRRLAGAAAPRANERGELAVPARVALHLDLRQHSLGRAPVLFDAVRVRLERLLQCLVKHSELARLFIAPVHGRGRLIGRPQPSADGVARQTRGLRYLVQRLLVA